MKICFVTTTSITIKSFILNFAEYLYDHIDCEITLICNNDEDFANIIPPYMRFIPVHMQRGISISGLRSILELKRVFKREQFDIVQYSTPNAAFYSSIAAKSSGIKNRLYCQWGIRYMGFEGIKREVFKILEGIICNNSTHIEAESFGILDFGLNEKLYTTDKAKVILNGSACGVDLRKYRISQKKTWREIIRYKLNCDSDQVLLGYAGRITADKGINELLAAFKTVSSKYSNYCRLVLIGSYDNKSSIDDELLSWAKQNPNILWVEWTDKIEEYYAALDVFISPSYREGFGLVVIEAAAMELPAIVTEVPGQIDSIIPNKTGLLCKPKEIDSLTKVIFKLVDDESLRNEMGKDARKFIEDEFDQEKLFELLMKERETIIREKA